MNEGGGRLTVGDRIKAIRTGRGMTVGSLAERTGLSKGLISQVENDKTSPSLTTLERLAEGLEVPAAYLLLKSEERIQVVRSGERPQINFGCDRVKVEVLSGRAARHLKAMLVELPVGISTGNEGHAHGGEEFSLVLEGRVRVTQGDESVVVEPGDSFHLKGCIPHSVANVGEGTAKIITVATASMLEVIGEDTETES